MYSNVHKTATAQPNRSINAERSLSLRFRPLEIPVD